MTVPSNAGFTLIELVFVMVLAAFIALFAGPRMIGTGEIRAKGYYEDLVSSARYAQKLAVASGCHVQLVVGTSSYELRRPATYCASGTYSETLSRPDGGLFAASAPPGVSISGAAPLNVVFSPSGATDLSPGSNATFSVDGYLMVIHADSGYVETP